MWGTVLSVQRIFQQLYSAKKMEFGVHLSFTLESE